jgi:phosphoribosylformylglycinamidine synthase
MNCPVVSGNVSLYNETPRGGIYPAPLVVTAGFVSHYAYFVSGGHARKGDVVYLAGPASGSLGASRWQVLCGGQDEPRGTTWRYDFAMERDFAARALSISRKADVKKSARVIAGGGLAVALAKEVIFSGVGMTIDISGHDPTEILFGEGGPRAVYIVPSDASEKFLDCWEGYPVTKLGEVGGESLVVKDVLEAACCDLRVAFWGGPRPNGRY